MSKCADFDFKYLIHPVDTGTFGRVYWEKQPLIVRRTDKLLSLEGRKAGVDREIVITFLAHAHSREAPHERALARRAFRRRLERWFLGDLSNRKNARGSFSRR